METKELIASIREQIADLESMHLDDPWAVNELRAYLADAEDIERDERWIQERIDERAQRFATLVARAYVLPHGVRVPPPGVATSDIRRTARRLREGKMEPELPDDVRAEKARAIDESAELHQEVPALQEELTKLVGEMRQMITKYTAFRDMSSLVQREAARGAGDAETRRAANRARHREEGRPRKRK